MAYVGSSVVKCSEGWSLRAALKRKKNQFLKDPPNQKWPKSGTLATRVYILNTRGNFSPTGKVGGLSKPFTQKKEGGLL